MASAGQESVKFELPLERQPTNPAASTMPGGRGGSVPRRAVLFLAACAAGLIPWTVGLAVTLPHSYVVGTWTLTWTGFDVALIGCFAVTAWALWKQRQIALPAAITTAVLLLCDAWFDLLTAHRGGGLLVSATTAVFGEIPIAIVMAGIAAKLLRANAQAARATTPSRHAPSLWRTPLPASQDRASRSDTPARNSQAYWLTNQ
jgi:hypothetical protein